MMVKKLKLLAVALLIVGLAGAGAGLTNHRASGDEPGAAPAAPPPVSGPAAGTPRPPARAERATYRGKNFMVTAPTPVLAQKICLIAEKRRAELAFVWFGRTWPDWPEPCPVRVHITERGSGGMTTFQFKDGKLVRMNMRLEGPLDRILADHLPHEITHAILADWAGRGLPRWADEGAAILAESPAARLRQELAHWELLNEGRIIPLRRLLAMHDYPADAKALHAQGYSLTDFLVNARGRGTFLSFITAGEREGWNKAVRDYYKYDSVDDLQAAWLADVRKGRRGWGVVAADPPPPPPAREPAGPVPPAPAPEPARPAVRLPLGPAPVQAVVALTKDGSLGVWRQRTYYQPVTTYDEHRHPVTSYRMNSAWVMERHDRADVRAFDARGKELDPKDWPRLVKGETLALAAVDGRPVDPLHLRLIKEGTLVFVLPGPRPVAPPAPAPVAVPAPAYAPPAVVAPPAPTQPPARPVDPPFAVPPAVVAPFAPAQPPPPPADLAFPVRPPTGTPVDPPPPPR